VSEDLKICAWHFNRNVYAVEQLCTFWNIV